MKNEKVEYSNEWCKYEFTTEEKRDIAETLAIKTKDLEKAEDEKKSVMSAFKEKIDKIALDVKSSARKYTDGYEMRDIECVVERDFVSGEVRYIRTDNGVVARTSKMTMAERQMKIEDAARDAGGDLIQGLQDSLAPGESMTISSGDRSVTLNANETDEERRQRDNFIQSGRN